VRYPFSSIKVSQNVISHLPFICQTSFSHI
jgi:hypothetical protein